MGGTPKRMENFAHFIMDEIGYKLPAGTQLQDISAFSYRYSMYKVCSFVDQTENAQNNRIELGKYVLIGIFQLGWTGVIDKSWHGSTVGRHSITRND